MDKARLLVPVLATAIGVSSHAFADVLLDGAEFQINTYTTSAQAGKRASSVARAPDGSFVVVWQSSQDGSAASVHGQRYDNAGAPVGTEFQVNTYTTSYQFGPAVAAAADGSFIVVWKSVQDGVGPSIQGQRYDSTGAPVGTEFQVNTYATSAQINPAVAAAADGSFVVVWESFGPDGSSWSVQGQRYDSAGTPVGTEFQVNTYTTSDQVNPAVSAVADGFVVVWEGGGDQDGDSLGVFAQRFDSAGVAVGTELQVNSHTTSDQSSAAVSAAEDGSFAVVWQSDGQDGDSVGVFGQRFDSSGAADGSEFQVNTYTTGAQGDASSIAADADGKYVVAWASPQDGSGVGMFGQRLCVDINSNASCDSEEICAPAAPVGGCLTGTKASLQVKDNADDGKDQVKWKLSGAGLVDQAMLGDPVGSRSYALCIYDETSSSPELVSVLEIAPSTKWLSKDPKGFQYKDSAGTEAGVTKAQLKTGAAGKSKAQVGAKGLDIPMPTPISMTEIFDQDTKVIVQLVNDQTSLCWTSEFTTATKNDATQFKAKTP